MILKDYLIIDNVLDNPKYVIELAKQTEFFCKTPFEDGNLKLTTSGKMPGGNWYGCRSRPLHVIYQDFFEQTFNHIFELCFPSCNYRYVIKSFFHLTNENVKKQISSDKWWHKDSQIFAGIIFLNSQPKPKSGIMLKTNNDEVVIENVFNRLVMYRGNILHRPQDSFGSNLEDTRLTLVFFVEKIQLE